MHIATQLELAIWSGMAGALFLLSIVAAADLVASRSIPSARGLAFIVLTGGSSTLLSGLPEMLIPAMGAEVLLPLKASFGPLSGALALTYLGVWLGSAHDDQLIDWIVSGGSVGLVLAAVILAAIALLGDVMEPVSVIAAAATVNALSVLCAGIVAFRGATLGDKPARWMVVACVCLAGMVGGLYATAMHPTGLGIWVFTAVCTIFHFLIVIALTLQRNRELRKLNREAKSLVQPPLGGDMALGSRLVPHVEDALWRSARFGRECVVAAISVPNLYELVQVAGTGVEQQILVALMARIRRIVGFRNVVGLYHPRCFILVVSAVQDPRRGELLATRLLGDLRKPVRVGEEQRPHLFQPSIGIGMIRIKGRDSDAMAAMNRAEQLALAAVTHMAGVIAEDFGDAPQGLAVG